MIDSNYLLVLLIMIDNDYIESIHCPVSMIRLLMQVKKLLRKKIEKLVEIVLMMTMKLMVMMMMTTVIVVVV